MSKTMLINTVQGHECRIAILDSGRLQELYTERASSASQVGSIFKGRVTNIEPSIQAAFIDFGGVKNGFLHISDIHPQHFPKSKDTEAVGRRTAHRTRPPIQQCLKRGQEVVVQMTKQGIGTKGPTLTTYLSIPGRLLVMMPGMTQVGVSRKIEDEDIRLKLRKSLEQLDLPKGMGVIIRTAGIDRTKRDLQRDLAYLTRLWDTVEKKAKGVRAPAEIYQESDLVTRTLRDVFDSTITRIVCDDQDVALTAKEFLDLAVPRAKCRIEYYQGRHGLFDHFGVEEEITRIHSHRVEMRNGGSLVIDQTEALVAIDVNSGSFRAHQNAEQNALNLNLSAAEEIGRQLRLRDLGGVIVMDFIDMRDEKNRRSLERKIRDVLKKDRAKSKVTRISAFGLVEMTRQRLRPSLKQSIYARCPHCAGTGQIMSPESMALAVMRDLKIASSEEDVAQARVIVSPDIAMHLANSQRKSIADLERDSGKRIVIACDADLTGNDVQIECTNARGAPISWDRIRGKGGKDVQSEFVDVAKLKRTKPKPVEPEQDAETPAEPPEAEASEQPTKKKRRRRGGRRRKKSGQSAEAQSTEPSESHAEDSAESEDAEQPMKPAEAPEAEPPTDEAGEEQPAPKKKRRRGRRGGRKRRKSAESAESGEPQPDAQAPDEAQPTPAPVADVAPPPAEAPAEQPDADAPGEPAPREEPKPKRKAAKRTRRKKAVKAKAPEQPQPEPTPPVEAPTEEPKPVEAPAPVEESKPVEEPAVATPKARVKKKATKKAAKKTAKKTTKKAAKKTVKKAAKKTARKAASADRRRDPDEIPSEDEW